MYLTMKADLMSCSANFLRKIGIPFHQFAYEIETGFGIAETLQEWIQRVAGEAFIEGVTLRGGQKIVTTRGGEPGFVIYREKQARGGLHGGQIIPFVRWLIFWSSYNFRKVKIGAGSKPCADTSDSQQI